MSTNNALLSAGLLAAFLVAGTLTSPSSAASSVTVSAAISKGGVSISASRMPKWRAIYARHRATAGSAAWQSLVREARALPKGQLIEGVNAIVNRARYVAEGTDRWAAPAELRTRGGDCEDFAIAKYLLLKELGVPTSTMHVLLSRTHAVLAVNWGGSTQVLDNRRSSPYQLSSSTLSRAVFAINDKTWWINTAKPVLASY